MAGKAKSCCGSGCSYLVIREQSRVVQVICTLSSSSSSSSLWSVLSGSSSAGWLACCWRSCLHLLPSTCPATSAITSPQFSASHTVRDQLVCTGEDKDGLPTLCKPRAGTHIQRDSTGFPEPSPRFEGVQNIYPHSFSSVSVSLGPYRRV